MTADQNGWCDSPEEEREAEDAFEADMGRYDPYEGWGEELCGPEYWLYRRNAERGEA